MPRHLSGLISRASWGARHPDGFADRPIPTSENWLHHSVTIAPDLLPPFKDDDAAIRTLEEIGQREFGGGISYTVIVTPVGRTYEGHSYSRRGAHTGGHNTVAAAYCLVGNYENMHPTPQQEEAIAQGMVRARREGLSTRHTLNGGHRDTGFATACPGRHAYIRIAGINARAAALWNGNYAVTPTRPTKVITKVVKTVTRSALAVDGDFGPKTIRQWQKVMGTYQDGAISTGRGGSTLIRAVQQRLHIHVDGFLGPLTWKAIQKRLNVAQDGVPGPITIKALQRRLNANQF